ncbi:MAG: hypothetical protein FJX47_07345 [Alphaproteobacteria bacterium]|nr:hypothetical protein [Alphaproteobacteria bacterium]
MRPDHHGNARPWLGRRPASRLGRLQGHPSVGRASHPRQVSDPGPYEVVRRSDRERFLCLLFAPEPARTDLIALTTFDLELARVVLVAREPILAAVRLAWWRDELGKALAGGSPSHPLLASLAMANARRRLDRALLDDLISSREAAAVPSGALSRLWVNALGVEDEASHRAAGLVGTAQGLIRQGASPDQIRKLIAEARSMRPSIDRRALPALLPALLVERRLADPEGRGVLDPLRLVLAALLGRY